MLIQLSLTLLEHWQPSTLGMKNDVGLAKESGRNQAKESGRPSEGISSSDTALRKFLGVAGYST